MNHAIEHFFTCPYCWEEVSVIVDPGAEEQSYVEDCEVCCRPIQIQVTVSEGEVTAFTANALDQ